ncbi:SCA-like protein, partial [Mya arenaria]
TPTDETIDLDDVQEKENDLDLEEDENGKSFQFEDALILMKLINELKRELHEVKYTQRKDKEELIAFKDERENDRSKVIAMETEVKGQGERLAIAKAELVQLRQLTTGAWDRATKVMDSVQDNSLLLEGLVYFKKDAEKEIRRFKEYKERAAKRFHQLNNSAEKNEREISAFTSDLHSLSRAVDGFGENLDSLSVKTKNLSSEVTTNYKSQNHLRNFVNDINTHVNDSLKNLTTCCAKALAAANQKTEHSVTNQKADILTNEFKDLTNHHNSKIEIVEFGSGEYEDELQSKYEEETNKIGEKYPKNKQNPLFYGSGETIQEGSGEIGSGDTEELPPFDKIYFTKYVEKTDFYKENMRLKIILNDYVEKYANMSQTLQNVESKLANIQLGNFMQNLQESIMNFTQNVITVDQWKLSSNQIVNSTLYNQDQVIKLTNMVLDSQDKVTDLNWKLYNNQMMSDQQLNILRMYIIKLNNSMEDLKEDIKKLERADSHVVNNKFQYPSFYGYQTGYKVQYSTHDETDLNQSENDDTDNTKQGPTVNSDTVQLIMSKLEELGLQIVFNQNRLGNLEVKILNDTLTSCRKFNMDTAQDTQLASHESIIKSNANSIILTHNLVRELEQIVKLNNRKIRGTENAVTRLQGIIPAMVAMKREMENFLETLPSDCSEYYDRGYRKSGVYVIHPITVQSSSHVMCHMTQDGGWTVIQQRFNGSVNFKRNWTNYSRGFGSIEGEHWLGNYLIHLLTSNRNYSLEIVMVDFYDVTWLVNYDHFSLSEPNEEYSLEVSGYHGNATDGMGYSTNMAFSTIDNDNDGSSLNCAFFYEAGWWYKHCQTVNLNGRYDIGFVWFNLDTSEYIRLKSSVMRIKPR